MADVIKVNVPTFLRILELVREEIKGDADLHDIAEIMTEKSKAGVITMADYPEIVEFIRKQKTDVSERYLNNLKKLSGL